MGAPSGAWRPLAPLGALLLAGAAASGEWQPPDLAQTDRCGRDEEACKVEDASSVSLLQVGARAKLADAPAAPAPARALQPIGAPEAEKSEAAPRDGPWFLCRGPTFRPGAAPEMACTQAMSFRDLCCAPWAAGLAYPVLGRIGTTVAAELEELAGGEDMGTQPLAALCHGEAPGDQANRSVLETPMRCARRLFSAEQLAGTAGPEDSEGEHIGPGEAVLREHLRFMMDQGVPANSAPTCQQEAATCPDGAAPASLRPSFLGQLLKESSDMADEARQLLENSQQGHSHHHSDPVEVRDIEGLVANTKYYRAAQFAMSIVFTAFVVG